MLSITQTKASTQNHNPDNACRRQTITQHRKSLPIALVEKRLIEEVRKNDTLIIVGETGSAKTTQLPQFFSVRFSIEKFHKDQVYDRWNATEIHLEESPGDVLVFLTGQEEIESVEKAVQERVRQLPETSQKLLTVPIFSSLPLEQQLQAFAPTPSGFRKVILATNIAETSVTISGIRYVVDPGFVKARSYDPVQGLESLVIVPTSKAQALQRSGHAGREGPGKCFRLYPEREFDKLEDSSKPEIKRCTLSNVILQGHGQRTSCAGTSFICAISEEGRTHSF